MDKLAKKIADCLKAKIEGMGVDNITGNDLVEFGMWTDIIKDMACFDKDMRIIEAMDEAEENEEKMGYIEEFEDYPERRYYRGQPRSKTSGRYMKRGDGRRGYEDMMYYGDMEHMRDMDRHDMHRMYYAGDSRSETARRGYMETKEMHKDNSPEAKQKKMRELEKYVMELGGDITDMIADASPEERAMLKNKMQTLVSKL